MERGGAVFVLGMDVSAGFEQEVDGPDLLRGSQRDL
jgi:hypothetical protein